MTHLKFRRILIFAIALLSLLLPLNAQTKKDVKKSNQLIEQGNKDFRQKNYTAAIEQYSQAIATVPKNAPAHFWKGYAHYYLKQPDQALSELSLAADQGYPAIEIYKVRWFLNFERKDYDAALKDVDAALQIEPKNLTLLRAAGDINLQKGNFREALRAYQETSLATPSDADLFYHIASAQQGLNDPAGQAKAAEEAIAKRTQFLADAYFILGDAYQKQHRMSDAANAYEKALNSRPDVFAAYRSLSNIYRSENRFDDAIAISKRGLRQFPLNGELYTDLSWYYSLAGRNEEAIDAAKAGIQILPNRSAAYTNLCRAYNEVNKPEMAIRECTNALKINAEDGETHFYLGRAYDLVGKNPEAVRNYERSVSELVKFTRDNPDESEGFYLLGNAYFATGNREKAIDAYRKCLELSPKFAKAKFNLGRVLVIQKNRQGAMEQYSGLRTLDPALAEKLKAEIDKL